MLTYMYSHMLYSAMYKHIYNMRLYITQYYYTLGYNVNIRESVDSLCRDGADMPIQP